MPDAPLADPAGIELAGELLSDGRSALLAFLVRAEEGGDAVELGAWEVIKAGKLVRPSRLLVFPVGDVDRVRALAERAADVLLHEHPGQGGDAVRVCEGGLTVTTAPGPDGTPWATLAQLDGSGLAAVPAAAIKSLVRVLAETERALAELGRVALLDQPRG